MSFFSVNHLSAGYGKKSVLQNIHFELQNGCLMGILGANGSGKTTLLKAICGIVPHAGSCVLEGKSLEQLSARKLARLCSYIPQRSGITIDLSVLDVVLMGLNPQLGLLAHPTEAMRTQAREILKQVGLSGKENENYMQLSEGQKQLCILARTFVADSKLFLLDEPESALDFRVRYRMLEILCRWIQEKKIAALITLHDPALALNYCDRLLILSQGEIVGSIFPKTDSMEKMERMLEKIYGSISLQRVTTRNGNTQLVMLREDVG